MAGGALLGVDEHLGRQSLARDRLAVPGDADLEPGLLARPERAEGHLGLRADSISGHTHERRTAATALFATDADPDHLSRGRLGPDEEVGRFDVEDPHRPLPSACGSGCR